ncbi:trypsin-3-like [Harmonia axyridis]|uniref:trypsin-3-like n=1 Tax=Harmonia axyridis TaxID=115357 RepID=UPI001E27904F|nr:trypsin-3-like [Harmonia axyridis]
MYSFVVFTLIWAFTDKNGVRGTEEEDFDFRIIDGKLADIQEFPYQVSIMHNGSHHCGGSILSHYYILTAAHCTAYLPAYQFSVRVGSSVLDKGGMIHQVQEIYGHPNFTTKFEYDVAIMKLETPLKYSNKVLPIQLAEDQQRLPPAGTLALVAGWGRIISTKDEMSPHLMFMEVPLLPYKLCKELYSHKSFILDDRMFCAGKVEGGIDSCFGDSGGALVIDGIQYGIVSWGIGCALKNRPGVYASVPRLRKYILEQSGI